MQNKTKLRVDIEALRGLSVILVILYHFRLENLDFQIIKGGFLGVDIFFVISGFIITKIIIENDIQKFSLLNFYERRIKRIIPLFSVVLIISTISLPFIFNDFLVNKNVNSSIATTAAISNFYFWLTSTLYQFAQKNNLINLHFWSLAIEIQFYIFFPLLFVFFRKKEKLIHLTAFILFLISYLFVIKIYKVHNFFNFYNSGSRVFEFFSGVLIFFYSDYLRDKIKKKFHSYIYVLGIIILFLYLYFFNVEGRHPNPFSIILIIGMALLIVFNNEKQLAYVKNKLSYLGKISYSLYLWHFPILLIGFNYFKDFTDFIKLLLILLCFIISTISYLLIENKFKKIKLKYSLFLYVFLIAVLVFFKLFVISDKKNYSDYNLDNYFLADESFIYLKNQNKISLRKQKNIFSFEGDSVNFSPQFDVNNKKKKILIVGDSHSKDLFNIFKTNENKYKNYEFARYGINLIDLENYRKNFLVSSHNFKLADYILYTQRYEKNDLQYIEKLLDLSRIQKKKLIIFLKRPEFKDNDKKNRTILDKFYLEHEQKIQKENMDKFLYKQLNVKNFKKINQQIRDKYTKTAVFYDLYEVICDQSQKKCHSVNESGNKIFYDYGHLTLNGSKFIGNILFEKKFHTKFLE